MRGRLKVFPSIGYLVVLFSAVAVAGTAEVDSDIGNQWQSPPDDILDVLYASMLPWVWVSPVGDYLLLADPVTYPPLEELAAPMYKLAGIRVNPALNNVHGRHGGTSPRLVNVDDGGSIPVAIPDSAEVLGVDFTSDGEYFSLTVGHSDHLGLWIGSRTGECFRIDSIELNPLLGTPVRWLPDQRRLVVLAIPERGEEPEPPTIPPGPMISQGDGASARSTYEARNLLQTAHDEELFDYYCKSQITIVDPFEGNISPIGEPAHYYNAEFSPNGEYILVEKVVEPWSHEVAWWRFSTVIEIWDEQGGSVAEIASLPLADQVPIHGVRLGPRSVSWRATAPSELFWVEALDGGDPVAEVPYRDRLMKLAAPFHGEPEEVFLAEHRIYTWQMAWGSEGGTLFLSQYERMRRWMHVWLLDVDTGDARLWYDVNVADRYNDPGYPVMDFLPNGGMVMHQVGDAVYFRGTGGTDEGDRPFLDLRDMNTGETRRVFRCDPNRYEYFQGFAGSENRLIIRSESRDDVPNYHLVTMGESVEAPDGEATRSFTTNPITQFQDPTPQLRQIEKRIIHYHRDDGVPLSFHLYLPPGYQEGTRLPTVVSAYPLEYSGAETAGQVRGSSQRFMRMYGSTHLYFLLRGYAVLDQTAMPMIGDPETTYDTFVPQLVADAEAAVAKAVEIGVADPDRVGVIGHSHGALMVANLLAHTDLFKAGIARSGSYNKTNQPFGFQSERRSLFQARETYIQLSPTFFADQIDEPILIIHGNDDSNPGTLTFQSEILYEAVRGSGGTARLVLLPYEDHGYRARESVEHVIWEQLRWFDMYMMTPAGADPVE